MTLDVYCKECGEICAVDFGDAISEDISESGELEFCCDQCGTDNSFYLSIIAQPINSIKK